MLEQLWREPGTMIMLFGPNAKYAEAMPGSS